MLDSFLHDGFQEPRIKRGIDDVIGNKRHGTELHAIEEGVMSALQARPARGCAIANAGTHQGYGLGYARAKSPLLRH